MDDHSLRLILADDEAPAREELIHLLEGIPGIEVVGSARDGSEAQELLRREKPDLALLDIQMPGLDGLALARKMREEGLNTLCIFITAYDAFAVRAFEVHAVDYLLKPIRPARLREALDTAAHRLQNLRKRGGEALSDAEKLAGFFEDYLRKQEMPREHQFLSVFQGGQILPIRTDKILFAEARGRHVWIVTAEGEYESHFSFREAQDHLSGHPFYACHRSFIVNLEAIETIDLCVNNSYRLKIRGSETDVPVSRSHMAEFRRLMGI